jgi:uncharacterized membrane protein YbhN (UPF0104 family)
MFRGTDAVDHTLVITDTVHPRRVRRPIDLARFVLALLGVAAIAAGSYLLTATSSGVERGAFDVIGQWSTVVQTMLRVVAGLGAVALPVAAAVDLVVRRRSRQLVDALGTMLFTIAVSFVASGVVATHGPDRLLIALTGHPSLQGPLVDPYLAGLVAFVTVARLIGRGRWGWYSAVTIASVSLTGGSNTTSVIGLSLLGGWAVGLASRYTLGTPTTRPSGIEVGDALDRAGLPVNSLRATTATAYGREYQALTSEGEHLRVLVFDRDHEGAGLVAAAWRQLRLRTDPANPRAFSMRSQMEHAALVSFAANAARARVPRLRAAIEAGPDSTLLAYDHIDGATFDTLPPQGVTDADLDNIFRAVQGLHDSHIVHRGLTAAQFIRDDQNRTWLTGVQHGAIAASDLQERIDLAELLCTAALLTNAERAVAAGVRVVGGDRLARALPALQTIAFSTDTRRLVRGNRQVLMDLRDALLAVLPVATDSEPLDLRRFAPRTLFAIGAASIATYVLISQLAGQDLVGVVRSADSRWALLALFFSTLTFAGAAMSLSGFVPERLSHPRTLAAQLAAGFATLVSPPTIGTVAVNVRYLQKSGLHPALAAASVGLSQVFAFFVHIGLILLTAVLAGQSAQFSISPPRSAIIGTIAVVASLSLLLLSGHMRRRITSRVRPIIAEIGPRLISIGQRPWKIVEGMGGILLLNAAFVLCMIASIRAFGAVDVNYAAIALVYLAGSTLGQAAPTPGGLGAVELAYVAGLTAAGLESSVAVSATLLFRLLTFWLPTIPGYWSLNWLQKVGSL